MEKNDPKETEETLNPDLDQPTERPTTGGGGVGAGSDDPLLK